MRMGATVPGARSAVFRRARSPGLCRPRPAGCWWWGCSLRPRAPGQQSGAAEDPVYFLAQHRVLRGQDPVFVDQFRQRHGPARFGEPMVRGRDELVVRFVEFSWCSGILTASMCCGA